VNAYVSPPFTPHSDAVERLWAVRLDWPTGDHEFCCAHGDAAEAARELDGVRRFWARGPIRPVLTLVLISRHDLDLHTRARPGCRAPDCPLP
jgi:hypothetical protein